MSTPLSVFRIIATEFESVIDDAVSQWIELTEPLVSKKRFGKLHLQALALLTAHRMKLAGASPLSDNVQDEMALVGEMKAKGITSYSEGGVSIGIGNGGASGADAEYLLTEYGIQYLSLRRRCIVPIINSGEPVNVKA